MNKPTEPQLRYIDRLYKQCLNAKVIQENFNKNVETKEEAIIVIDILKKYSLYLKRR